MPKSLAIPKFHTRDFTVLVASMVPFSVLMNYILYGSAYFSSAAQFVFTTLVTFLYLGSGFISYGVVAVSLRTRFPEDHQTFRRLVMCLGIFYLMSAIYMTVLLWGYDFLNFYGYEYLENDFVNAYLSLIVVNTFLTFLNEGIYRFERFSTTIRETEQLKKEYMQSQLLGLKSQMNPHFLFNGLNTLSSLIHEDADRAETFLDHMSKVYRYLLRNNEEKLVTIETEVSFIKSYYYLLKARHEEGLQLHVDIDEDVKQQWIPPLTLQMIFENAMNQNVIRRSRPLHIRISSTGTALQIVNTVQPKINNNNCTTEIEDNINNKYRLLCGCEIRIEENRTERSIVLPALENRELYA